MVGVDALAMMKKKEKSVAEKKNAQLLASIDSKAKGKDPLVAQKKEAAAKMPVAPIKYKNVGIFSMGAAFLVGILLSLLFPEKESEDRFADEKLREYVGIGAE
jgi:Na+(H+)/acetate symporter ActP